MKWDDPLVIGIGNDLRGDDAIGLLVARRLRLRAPELDIREHSGDGSALLELWDGRDHVIAVNAVSSGLPAGTVHLLRVDSRPLPATLSSQSSTHALGLAQAVELARTLGTLPARLIIFGIEGINFELNTEPVNRVVSAGEQVVSEILRELEQPAAATKAIQHA